MQDTSDFDLPDSYTSVSQDDIDRAINDHNERICSIAEGLFIFRSSQIDNMTNEGVEQVIEDCFINARLFAARRARQMNSPIHFIDARSLAMKQDSLPHDDEPEPNLTGLLAKAKELGYTLPDGRIERSRLITELCQYIWQRTEEQTRLDTLIRDFFHHSRTDTPCSSQISQEHIAFMCILMGVPLPSQITARLAYLEEMTAFVNKGFSATNLKSTDETLRFAIRSFIAEKQDAG